MSKKKLTSIVISAILTIIATILGCVYGIEVDFEDIDLEGNSTNCSAITHEQQK